MAGIRFDLSSPEAVERFHDLAVSLLEITGELTPDLYKKLEKKAEEFCVHKADFDETLWEIFKHDLSLLNNLGDMYFNGEGVEEDYSEAIKWYRRAAEQGLAVAQKNLGNMYYIYSEGVEKDYSEAIKWYRKAAEQEHAEAQNMVGRMYNEGWGVKADHAEAVKWYRKAAEHGLAVGQNNLGFMYFNGEGVEKDYTEAAKWFMKAAEQGHASAQYNLGHMYKNGEGVEKDYSEAVKWLRKASEQGHSEAKKSLEELKVKSTVIRRRTTRITTDEDPRFAFLELTALDNVTGLVWAKDANLAEESSTWHDANKFIKRLNKFNYAGNNNWRLPYIKELEALVNFLKDDLYVDKYLAQKYIELGFINVKSNIYWSLTPAGNSDVRVLCANMKYGGISRQLESMKYYVWPVCNKN